MVLYFFLATRCWHSLRLFDGSFSRESLESCCCSSRATQAQRSLVGQRGVYSTTNGCDLLSSLVWKASMEGTAANARASSLNDGLKMVMTTSGTSPATISREKREKRSQELENPKNSVLGKLWTSNVASLISVGQFLGEILREPSLRPLRSLVHVVR